MGYIIAANIILVIHLGFVGFVILGAFLVMKWRWVAYLHIPAAIWGMLIEFQGWICPLTPWEQQFRQLGNQSGYTGGFIEHYLLAIIYPTGLTREVQIVLGVLVLGLNLILYGWMIARKIRNKRNTTSSADSSKYCL
ncbi:MAG: DUF2784 domain-containing protein [candidate division Zixibacteria bacterium]